MEIYVSNIFKNCTNSSYDIIFLHTGRDHAYQLRDAMAMYENNTLWPNMPKVGFPTLTLSNVCFNDIEATLEPLGSESSTLDESILYDIGEHIDNNDRCITERLSMVRNKQHYYFHRHLPFLLDTYRYCSSFFRYTCIKAVEQVFIQHSIELLGSLIDRIKYDTHGLHHAEK